MYIPNHFRNQDRKDLIAFMRANSFAILVTQRDRAPFATHLPLVIKATDDVIVLRGHVAKANPHWQSFMDAEAATPSTSLPTETSRLGEEAPEVPLAEVDSLVIFHGPHAYISPAHYETKQNVPTWNYIAVHAYGVPRIVEAKTEMLEAMIEQYDVAYQDQWHALSGNYKVGMLNGIVAFEIAVSRLEGKAKISQNRPEGDQLRVAEALGQSTDPSVVGIAQAMSERRR